jgi:hypothetical protein
VPQDQEKAGLAAAFDRPLEAAKQFPVWREGQPALDLLQGVSDQSRNCPGPWTTLRYLKKVRSQFLSLSASLPKVVHSPGNRVGN